MGWMVGTILFLLAIGGSIIVGPPNVIFGVPGLTGK